MAQKTPSSLFTFHTMRPKNFSTGLSHFFFGPWEIVVILNYTTIIFCNNHLAHGFSSISPYIPASEYANFTQGRKPLLFIRSGFVDLWPWHKDQLNCWLDNGWCLLGYLNCISYRLFISKGFTFTLITAKNQRPVSCFHQCPTVHRSPALVWPGLAVN